VPVKTAVQFATVEQATDVEGFTPVVTVPVKFAKVPGVFAPVADWNTSEIALKPST
jgi:hypothetical protein